MGWRFIAGGVALYKQMMQQSGEGEYAGAC